MKHNKGHYHEQADRLSIMQSNLEDFMINSPSAKKHKKYKKLLEQAQEKLSKAYVMISLKI